MEAGPNSTSGVGGTHEHAVTDSVTREGTVGDLNGSSGRVQDDPKVKMTGLDPDQTTQNGLPRRTVSQAETSQTLSDNSSDAEGTDNSKFKEAGAQREAACEARRDSSLEQLEEEQETLLKKAGEKFKTLEQKTVLGKALAALNDPDKAAKGVKVTITPAGEDEPIQLIPPDKKALKGRDANALMKQAKELLLEFNTETFAGYDSTKLKVSLDMLKRYLSDVSDEIFKKGNGKQSDYQDRLDNLERRQVTIEWPSGEGEVKDDDREKIKAKIRVVKEKPELPLALDSNTEAAT